MDWGVCRLAASPVHHRGKLGGVLMSSHVSRSRSNRLFWASRRTPPRRTCARTPRRSGGHSSLGIAQELQLRQLTLTLAHCA